MHKLSTKSTIIFFLILLISFVTNATTYYVSSTGSNYKAGTSISTAWSSISMVNSKRLYPGDVVLFEGGKTFSGSLYLDSNDKGTATAPIVIGSYGKGWAVISSGTSYGIYAYNTAGIKINRLRFKGVGRTTSQMAGIYFYMALASTRLNYINIDSVEVYGFRESGILIGSNNQTSGYDNVRVTNSKVHDNGNAGISSFAQANLGHKNFYIARNKVYNNAGLADVKNKHTGSGIMLGGVDGGTIEYCEAYNNGWLNAYYSAGPVGIWGYKCNNLKIQNNESHHNRTGTTKDGGGFDFDGGCTNSIMQYNYSHNNDGAGYLLAQYGTAPPMKNNVIRYNISENDGRKNGYAGIQLWSTSSGGGIQGVSIYNNSVFVSPASTGSPKGIYVMSGYITNAKIRNNIIQTTGGMEVIRVQATTDIRFEGNNYWSSGAALKFFYTGTTYSTIEKWRQVTGQEKINGVAKGLVVNPGFTNPGSGVTIGDPTRLPSLTSYKLKSTSSVINKGLNLAASFGIDVGKVDFWKNSIAYKQTFNIGSHQVNTTTLTSATNATAPLASEKSEITEELASPKDMDELAVTWTVFPNPTTDKVQVKLGQQISGEVTMDLMDASGKTIEHLSIQKTTDEFTQVLALENLNRGLYFIHVSAPGVKEVKKVIKQ